MMRMKLILQYTTVLFNMFVINFRYSSFGDKGKVVHFTVRSNIIIQIKENIPFLLIIILTTL